MSLSMINARMESIINLLQVEIELLRTIAKLANALNTSTESFDYLYKPVDNWNPIMDLIGLPKNGEMIPGFPNPFSRESFEDVFFDSLRVLVFRAKSMPGDNGIKTVALLL